MFRTSTSSFDRLLEKSTSQLLLEADWPAILAITDIIRAGEVQPKYAVAAIKKKIYHDNPHVALYALQVLESCVKNCGSLVHEEIATKAFMEEMREMVKTTNDQGIKTKLLEMIQNWGMAFRNSQKYRIVTDTLNLMKAEGWTFPPVREAEAMFEADVAPEWSDGEVCNRCRTQFGTFTRQHHCRACGQVFCSKCSAKTCVLPKFGIEKEVRVCDSCFDEFGPKESRTSSSEESSPMKLKRPFKRDKDAQRQQHGAGGAAAAGYDNNLPAEYLQSPLAQEAQNPPAKDRGGKTEAEIKEEEELQLALALSQSEAEEKEKTKIKETNRILSEAKKIQEAKAEETKAPTGEEELSPELMRYLNRDYWEKKEKEKEEQSRKQHSQQQQQPQQQQPAKIVGEEIKVMGGMKTDMYNQNVASAGMAGRDVASEEDLDEFVTTLKTQVEIFVNRMKSNSSRGRSIANDSSVQTLFMNTMAMHSQLLKHIQEQEDKRVRFELLQDKVTQVKDARAALEALREEERDRKRREAEEAERLRQIQIQEKLEVMRQKKQEYLQYQRQLALQRMQEQEREMLMRQEQAKQQYLMQQQQHQMPAAYSTGPPMYQNPYAPQAPTYVQSDQVHPSPQQEQQSTQSSQMGYMPHHNPGMMPPMMSAPPMTPPQQQMMSAPPVSSAPVSAPVSYPDPAYNMQGMAQALPHQMPHPQYQTPQQPATSTAGGGGELISFD